MKTKRMTLFFVLILINYFFVVNYITACTLIKITIDGITFIGNNEDNSNPDTRIWFEPGDKKHYGAVYVGYNNLFPEGGMNEAGLVCDAFGVSNKPLKDTLGKTPIFELDLKRKIMKECKTVEEVKALLNKYNLYFWSHGVWLFIDKSGKYLSVEGDSLVIGHNPYFVQTNFRQSEMPDEKQIDWRYNKAMALLKNHYETGVNFCASIMDSVHQGATLYTTIYDTKKGIIYLYYSHNYKKVITFNLKKELKKGERVLVIPELFPEELSQDYKYMLKLRSAMDSLITLNPSRDSLKLAGLKSGLIKLGYFVHVFANYGYEFLHQKDIPNAIKVFKIFVELFPQSSGGYDYLGEAYMKNKQYQLALDNYRHSIAIDPNNINGRQRINILTKLINR